LVAIQELLGSLNSKFDDVKETVNAELAGFAGDVRDALETGSLSKAHETAEDLLTLSLECIEMTPFDFRENCESIVQNLAEKRQQCQAGLVKQLLTRMLFILTRCTRLLQFQKDSGPIDEDSLVRFKQCLESVPAVDMKWDHKTVKTDFSVDSTDQMNLPKHPVEEESKVFGLFLSNANLSNSSLLQSYLTRFIFHFVRRLSIPQRAPHVPLFAVLIPLDTGVSFPPMLVILFRIVKELKRKFLMRCCV